MKKIVNIGETVICDLCNRDYTDSEKTGGALIGSYAYCPKCYEKIKPELKKYNEKPNKICPNGMTFKDCVLQLRGGNNTIVIEGFGNESSNK